MVRGLKKKLLIGLLSAAVVGTSLAPSVPLVGSFAQEVKATETKPEPIYKYTKVIVTPEAIEYGWEKNGNIVIEDVNGDYEVKASPSKGDVGYEFTTVTEKKADDFNNGKYYVKDEEKYKKAIGEFDNTGSTEYFTKGDSTIKAIGTAFKWPDNIPTVYFDDDKGTPGTRLKVDRPNDGTPVEVYTREVDTTKSKVTVAPSTDTKSKVTPKSIGSTDGAIATIDKNKATKITVDVEASAGKVIKSVVAKVINAATNKQIGSDITATKVDGTENTYGLLVTATEDTVKVLISTEEEDLLITPKLSSTLSSKVGTAELTSTSAVKPGKKIELKVTLADGATKDNVTVKANNQDVTGTLEDGVVTYSIDTTGVTDEELEIEVSGRLDNDGLEKAKTHNGSTATVENKGDAAADANDVLNVAKADQGDKYVNAKLNISTSDTTKTTELESEVDLAKKSGLKLAGYISIDFLRTVSDTPIPDGAAAPANSVTKLGALLPVNYFLPKDAIGKTGYKLIRFHDVIGEITTTPNADGEYIEVSGDKLILHVKLLSDFAVVYNDTDATPDVPDPDPVPKPDPDPTPVKPDPTPVKPNPVKPSSDTGTKAAKATTSTKKSSKTSSPKTADYAVNSLLALLTGAAGLFGITLINKKRKEDEE